MPNTYTLISSTTLANSTTSTISFSSIPQTYTDLVFRISSRSTTTSGTYDTGYFFNGTDFSNTQIQAVGSTASSVRTTGTDAAGGGMWSPTANVTADTFNSSEIYWPNYKSTASQPYSVFTVVENNSSTANVILATAQLWQSTSALTSVTLYVGSAAFVAGSSFYLYGIKNS